MKIEQPIRLLALAIALGACRGSGEGRPGDRPKPAVVKNVVFLIGDGMGFPQVTLCRMIEGPLALDELPVTGFVKTTAADRWVTDSAAASTAMASGIKTVNGAVGVDPLGRPVRSLLEDARDRGLRTGLVTTSRVTHATPAAFAAHTPNRGAEMDIARQLVEARVDVLIGGGRRAFTDDMVQGMTQRGALVGLFADSHIPYVLDRTERVEFLPEMTQKALDHLSRSQRGFFLMVEGARIDHACHQNDAPSSVAETREFDDAVRVALGFAKARTDTLLIATADHGTGALAITEKLQDRKAQFRRVTASTTTMALEMGAGRAVADVFAERAGVTDTTEQERRFVSKMAGGPDTAAAIGEIVGRRLGVTFIPLSYRRNPPDATKGHDGTMVPVYAYGPGAQRFSGTLGNTDIAKLIREQTGW